MKQLIRNWNVFRILRLSIGILILVEGIKSSELAILFFGGLFTLLPLFNIGCCTRNQCASPTLKKDFDTKTDKNISYEEIK